MKIGLFFGSFNPVHTGHMIIASHMVEYTDMNEVWMVVSPQNPLKSKASLAGNNDRLHLLHLAIGDHLHIRPSSIEFSLPVPSYTIDTLTYLKEKFPGKTFCLIMGGDNLATIHNWKNYELLLRDYDIYVYNRPGFDTSNFEKSERIHILEDIPMLDISATFIRQALKAGKSIEYLVPEAVFKYLSEYNIYK
ncbi:MAG: nicotinate-nucleotide adenylyltransferase [Saprospiraceae bacterium]|nr:nicotinate-nucleotide adenylyltransferase [Saprospiraceae bacterium]MCZ2336967.1 nicotinate-nucleotide adenylyltransferase [Chitinophagales bacterium]